MSLDQNLFTLNVTPNAEHPSVVDLVDPKGTVHYQKEREPGTLYRINVYEPLSESLLASATAPSATSKQKIIKLHNPSQVVELKSIGTLSFKWSFKWEEHEFEWKREECFMIRKPDPPVLVAVTKEPPGKLKTAAVQILDYNLNRFDINDRKGLEIALLTALLTFHDLNDSYHKPLPEQTSAITEASLPRQASGSAPPPPPKPAPKTGVDRIAEMHAVRGEVNDILVEDEGQVSDYAQYAMNLLEDEAMLFVTIHSSSAADVPKVLQVVEETKRIRHKRGLACDTALHQYVIYDRPLASSLPPRGGPQRIVLDDPQAKSKDAPKREYSPPGSLTIHLSKIPMPELQPRSTSSAHAPPPAPKALPGRPKSHYPDAISKGKGKPSRPPASPSPQGSTLKPPTPPRRPHSRAHTPSNQSSAHRAGPYPAPSPAQLNNPALYAASPPPPSTSAPRQTSGRVSGFLDRIKW